MLGGSPFLVCGHARRGIRRKAADDRQRGLVGAFVRRGRYSPTAGQSGRYRAALGRGSRYRMERLRHRRALLDGNSRKLRRPTGNI